MEGKLYGCWASKARPTPAITLFNELTPKNYLSFPLTKSANMLVNSIGKMNLVEAP
jgi:hypothetical protein